MGPEKAKFIVHKAILVGNCRHFKRLLASDMEGAQTNVFELPDEKWCVFNAFIDWIYFCRVGEITRDTDPYVAVDAWLLADKWRMRSWQNDLINALAKYWKDCRLEIRHVMWVAEKCAPGSLLHKFVMDQFAWEMDNDYAYYRNEHGGLDGLVNSGLMSVTELTDLMRDIPRWPVVYADAYHARRRARGDAS